MSCQNITVIGLQWGDEGKGKLVDALAGGCKYVVRFCGGANAGHTVLVGEQQFALHLIPSGILHRDVRNVVGNGVVFDPVTASEELAGLRDRGVRVGPDNLMISSAAHVVMPWHKLEDRLREQSLGGAKIGTTARGIGPCYADKAHRSSAIRVGDLLDADGLGEKIRRIGQIKNRTFQALYQAEPMDLNAMVAEFVEIGKLLGSMVCNTPAVLRKAIGAGDAILFEGGQGSLLDIEHGTFPFVTSSMVTSCGVPGGAGVSPKDVGRVVGIVKAYTSRVGAGPFPSEQYNAVGDRLRERGHEYGTTTGRPRRCGWLDAFAVKYAAELSGVDEIALTLFDVLSGFDELQICTGYTVDGQAMEAFDPAAMDRAECVYETLPGWSEDITACDRFDALPANAKAYVARVEELVGRPVGVVSVGPERTQTLAHHTQLTGIA